MTREMLRHFSFGTGFILVLALLGTNFGTQTNDMSTKLLLSSFAQSKVLLMGVLDQNLLIITKDSPPMVYQVPMYNYADSQIDLYGVVPMELKDKWPALNGNDNFTKAVLNSRKAKSFSIDMDKATLIFAFRSDIEEDHALLQTVSFTFKPPSTTYREFKIYDREFYLNQAHLISSHEQNVFFNLKISNYGKIHQLYKFVFNNAGGFKLKWEYNMCNGNGSIVFSKLDSQCSIDWKIVNGGFVYQKRFHLFTKDRVYIFDYPETDNSSKVVLKVVKLTDFFISIIPTPTTTDLPPTKPSKSKDGAIIIIIIGLSLIGLTVLFGVAVVIKNYFIPKNADQNDAAEPTNPTAEAST